MPSFEVQVVTPLGPVLKSQCNSVNAPGALGQFEVLEGHIPFLTELHTGVLVVAGENQNQRFAITNGFLEVEPGGNVKVLVEKALLNKDVDVASAQAKVSEVGEKLKAWDKDIDGEYQSLLDEEAWVQAQIDAAHVN